MIVAFFTGYFQTVATSKILSDTLVIQSDVPQKQDHAIFQASFEGIDFSKVSIKIINKSFFVERKMLKENLRSLVPVMIMISLRAFMIN